MPRLTGALLTLFVAFGAVWANSARSACQSADNISLQVLGSGGPELSDHRASTSYLIWIGGRARILVDAGPGSSLLFERSGADFADLSAVLLTHLHVDHSSALPAYIKGAFFTDRNSDLPIYGPAGNERMPATTAFVNALFGSNGIYRYLSDYLLPEQPAPFKIKPVDIALQHEVIETIALADKIQLQTIEVHHGPIAAIAWRVNIGSCSLVFSGDMSNRFQTLVLISKNADLLVAHNAVPESATGVAANLHMRPSDIGEIAARAEVRQLLLSHRMRRTLGSESQTLSEIKSHYSGTVTFADSLTRIELSDTPDPTPR